MKQQASESITMFSTDTYKAYNTAIDKLFEKDQSQYLEKEMLRAVNPNGRNYVAVMKLQNEIFYKEFRSKNIPGNHVQYGFNANAYVCVVTDYPFFSHCKNLLISLLGKKERLKS